jgi:dolichol-phosphate mannosyltransferase
MRAIVVVPTYNERENLPRLVEKIRQEVDSLDILVVDDNSPDGTGRLADELSAASGNRLFVLHRERKEGLGRAYVAGFRRALEMGYDVIVQMDADLSHDPSYLPAFLARIQDADLVLGSRYVQGICVVNWDFKRLLLSKMATKYVRMVTGMPFSDTTGGFKCWRAGPLQAIGLDRVFSSGYLFQIEMTYRTLRKGYRVAEIPIIFYERNLGRSKMDWRVIWEALWGVLKLRFKC